MDNGSQRHCDIREAYINNESGHFCDDRLKLIEDNSFINTNDRLNEVLRDRRSATSRGIDIDNSSERRCSICDSYFSDVANQNFAHLRWQKDYLSDSDNYLVCEKCKISNINRYLNDVMMKNKNGGDDAHAVVMETDINGSNDDTGGGNRLMSNENVVDHLKGMSLSDRRSSITPRITLTNAEDDPSSQKPYHFTTSTADEPMLTDDDQCSSPLSPRFLAVPKIEELGPERRPPQLVPTM